MPVDREANAYWGTVNQPPDPPTEGLTLRVPNPQASDFADLTLPFLATVAFPGNATLTNDQDSAEVVYVTAIVGNVLTLDRFVPPHLRRAIRAGDQISATLVRFGPG